MPAAAASAKAAGFADLTDARVAPLYNSPVDPQRLEDIARRHGITLILRFGSSVAGLARPESDLDLAVLLERVPATLDQYLDLVHDLQTTVPEREVDVAVLNTADPLFLKKITERCVLVYGSSRRLQEFKMHALKRYQDHRKYLALEREYVARALRKTAR